MATVKQEWFLIKKNWSDWLLDLTDEEVGQFFKALYTGEVPPGLIGVFVKSHVEEFIRVNDKAIENKKARSEAGKKGTDVRWNNKPITNDNKPITNDSKVVTDNNVQGQVQEQETSTKYEVHLTSTPNRDEVLSTNIINK